MMEIVHIVVFTSHQLTIMFYHRLYLILHCFAYYSLIFSLHHENEFCWVLSSREIIISLPFTTCGFGNAV